MQKTPEEVTTGMQKMHTMTVSMSLGTLTWEVTAGISIRKQEQNIHPPGIWKDDLTKIIPFFLWIHITVTRTVDAVRSTQAAQCGC